MVSVSEYLIVLCSLLGWCEMTVSTWWDEVRWAREALLDWVGLCERVEQKAWYGGALLALN